VTKNLLSRAPPCFGRHVKPLVPVALAPTPVWKRVDVRQAAGRKNNCRIFITTPLSGIRAGRRRLCYDDDYFALLNIFTLGLWPRAYILRKLSNHHHQPINAPTAGAQAFLMDYSQRERAITNQSGVWEWLLQVCHLERLRTTSDPNLFRIRNNMIRCSRRTIFTDGRLVQWSVAQTTKPEVPCSSPGSGKGFCDKQLHLLTSHDCLYILLSI
jgi:hypothetical protein